MLTVEGLSKTFAGRRVVSDVAFTLQAGEILALIGPSGCGKTTTLRMIAGLEEADTGTLALNGRDMTHLPPETRNIGLMFQDYALFPHMTVGQNVGFGARGDVAPHLAAVGLAGMQDRYPDSLSGGQQQRVALARCLAAGPGVVLLDEPFSNLDPVLRGTTRREMRRMLKAAGVAVLIVTHDQEEALSFADRVAVMSDGRIHQIGAAQDVYDRPVDAFVANFLGRTNLIAGQVADGICATPFGPVPLAAADGPVTLSLRPEAIRLHPAPDGDGHITGVEFKGHDMTCWVDWNGTEVQVDAPSHPRFRSGDRVRVEMAAPPVRLA